MGGDDGGAPRPPSSLCHHHSSVLPLNTIQHRETTHSSSPSYSTPVSTPSSAQSYDMYADQHSSPCHPLHFKSARTPTLHNQHSHCEIVEMLLTSKDAIFGSFKSLRGCKVVDKDGGDMTATNEENSLYSLGRRWREVDDRWAEEGIYTREVLASFRGCFR